MMLTDEWYPTLTQPKFDLVADRSPDHATASAPRTASSAGRRLVLATGSRATPSSCRWRSSAPGGARWPRSGRGGTRLPRDDRPRLPQPVPALRGQHHAARGRSSTRSRRRWAMSLPPSASRRADARASSCGARRSRPTTRAARGIGGTVWHSLHQLVPGRARQRPQPVAVAVEHLRRRAAESSRNVRAEPGLIIGSCPIWICPAPRGRSVGGRRDEREVHRGRARPGCDASGGRREVRAGGAGQEPATSSSSTATWTALNAHLCRALHADPRLDGAWTLAITAKGSRPTRRCRGRRRLPAPSVHARRAAARAARACARRASARTTGSCAR